MTATAIVVRKAALPVRVGAMGLRAIREAQRLSQRELARRAGFKSKASLSSLEARRMPRLARRLCRLADVLGVTVDEVLGRVPPPPAPVDALARADRELLDAMREDAEALLGPQVLRLVGGWRPIARAGWLGRLFRIRDEGERRPPPGQLLPPAPRGWHRGWLSKRQRALERALAKGGSR